MRACVLTQVVDVNACVAIDKDAGGCLMSLNEGLNETQLNTQQLKHVSVINANDNQTRQNELINE